MSSEIVQPPPGRSHPDDSPADLSAPEPATPETLSPAPPTPTPPTAQGMTTIPAPAGSSSVDDLGLSLSQVSPDPLLEEFKPDSAAAAAEPAPAPTVGPAAQPGSWTALGLDIPPGPETSAGANPQSGVSAVISALNLDPRPVATPVRAASEDKPASSSLSEPFAGLDLSATAPSKAEAASTRAGEKDAARDEEDEFEDLPARGSSWPMTLLFSYASAVTIGLIWVLWGHRIAREREGVETDPFPATETAADPGHRADQSRKLSPSPPLPADRIIKLGQTARLGALEVTPLDVAAGPVTLVHEVESDEKRPGGDAALSLRLRLKNVSSDSILAPLDEAFIRERGRGIRDSFIETGPTRQIDMFPLAVVSEWSIVGQEFRLLRPGESYETRVVTAPDALAHLAPQMTWRVRLRTDVNQTETLGIGFGEDDIRKATGRSDKP